MSAGLDRARAERLLEELVAIPSLSGEEGEASRFLAAEMRELGFDRAEVDEVGNAIGELGDPEADRLVVLLGHIDTVPGEIAVRRVVEEDRTLLYGRGAVDAKGPLATFVAAAARLGPDWARRSRLRLVVVGAVEEEAATSRGARFIADRFSGGREPVPDACVIGEPSRCNRVTLGYKGRLLVDLRAERAMAHTAGPEEGLATVGVALWNRLAALASEHNADREREFERLQPSLRHISTDGSDAWCERLEARCGIRLPPDFDAAALETELRAWAATQPSGTTVELGFEGYEPAWRESPRTPLVASFLGAIRAVFGGDERPSFVLKTGTSDMNVVAPRWRCPILAYGPGDSALDHTPDEHIELDEYWSAVAVLETALERWAERTS